MKNITGNIRMVLVETTHPGNIGAAARAMKTMGQKNLYLVNPKIFPSAEATARAAGADDILANVVECGSLEEAVKDCILVIATSARSRNIAWPVYGARECAAQVVEVAGSGPVALVFGRESSGLSNAELEQCNAMLQISTNPEFNSLNVASAVQIICYEIMQTLLNIDGGTLNSNNEAHSVTAAEMQLFYEHLEQCMIDLGFYDPDKPRQLMRRLKCLFNRARLDENEMNIMRGLLAAAQKAVINRE